MQLFEIIGWIGVLLCIGLHIPLSIRFFKIFKGKERIYDEFPLQFLFGALSSEFWACYWTRQNNFIPFLEAMIQFTCSESFLVIYLYIYSEKKAIKYIFFLLAISLLLFGVYYISVIMIPRFYIVGIFALLANIIFYFLCIEKENTNLNRGKGNLISGSLVSFSFMISWLLFGLLIRDIKLIITRSLGVLLCMFNSGVLAVSLFKRTKKYGNKYKSDNIDNDNENDNENEKELEDL